MDPDPLSPKPGPTPAATCRADGWCWENPFPQGNDIHAMWVGSERDAWAGGVNGLLMHWNGTDWKESSSGSLATITSLSGSGPADLWALAEREKVLHWNGTTWADFAVCAPMPTPTSYPTALFSAGADDVWFTCVDGSVLHWDGLVLKTVQTSVKRLGAVIRGSAPADVWFIMGTETDGAWEVRHWDGTNLTRGVSLGLPVPKAGDPALTVLPIAPNDAWAVGGAAGEITHWDGASFKPVTHPPGVYVGAWASGPSDVWFTSQDGQLLHWDGSAFTIRSTEPLSDVIWGSGPTDVWALSRYRGNAIHWDGTKLTTYALNAFHGNGLAGSSARDVWMYGDLGRLRHFDGSSLSEFDTRIATGDIIGIWGASADDVWAVVFWDALGPGSGRLLRRRGTAWQVFPHTFSHELGKIHGSAADDIWVVGSVGVAEHWNGTTWTMVPTVPNTRLESVWVQSPRNAWAVGSETVGHWDGSSWTSVPVRTGSQFSAVWGAGPNDVWFASSIGMVHWDGASMSEYAISIGAPKSLWGLGSNDIWSSSHGSAIHWGGAGWTQVTVLPAGASFFGDLWGPTPNDIWAIAGPRILHWDGTSWQSPYTGLSKLWSVWGSGNELWVGGPSGAILHRRL